MTEPSPTDEQADHTPRVHDPVHRAAHAFEREGENLCVHTWMESGAHIPEHFHPSLEEHWTAIDGAVRVKLNGDWRDLTPADGTVIVARNTRHELRNDSERQVYLRADIIPAGRLQEFLTETAWAGREGLYNARNLPRNLRGVLWVAEVADRFRGETVMCSPPPALQRLIAPPIAWLARKRRTKPATARQTTG